MSTAIDGKDTPGPAGGAHALAESVARAVARGPHRMTVGMRALDPWDWIEDAPDFDAQLREKRRLLDCRDDVVAALPGSADAQGEVLALLCEHLARRFPDRYGFRHGSVAVLATGETVRLSGGDPPIATAGRLVPEDLCLMRPDEDGFVLVAAALCFPTRWRLADKLGRPMQAIHAPVPGYAEHIGAATDKVMAALDPGRPLWRHNWSLLDSPALYQPERVTLAHPAPETDLGERLWVRCERQTLTRLRVSGHVLFTIRIRQCTVADLCRIEGMAARLLGQITTMAPALRRYKRIDEVEAPLEDWLRTRMAAASTTPAPGG